MSKTEKGATSAKTNKIDKAEAEITTAGKKGQRPRTESEIREAFAKMKSALNNEDLRLQIAEVKSPKGTPSLRCTVLSVSDEEVKNVYGPAAGNTFMRVIEGAAAFGPYVRA